MKYLIYLFLTGSFWRTYSATIITPIITIELKQILDIGDFAKIDKAVPLNTIPPPKIGIICLPLFRLILAVNMANPLKIKVISRAAPKPIWSISR
jgi:hypothetical protein